MPHTEDRVCEGWSGVFLRIFEGTPKREPCSLWGLRVIYGNGIKGPY